MSTYDSVDGEAGSGGYLTIRRSIGNGISGDRWRIAHNDNLLVNGRTFVSGTINDAVTAFDGGLFSLSGASRRTRTVNNVSVLTLL
jgi:hypothetical protein